MQEQALAFAKCMRDHGIDMPDPTVLWRRRLRHRRSSPVHRPASSNNGPLVDFNSKEFKDANEACGGQNGGGFVISSDDGRRMKRRWLILGHRRHRCGRGRCDDGNTSTDHCGQRIRPTTTVPRGDGQGDADRSDRGGEVARHARLRRRDHVSERGTAGPSPDLPDPGTVLKQGDSPWQVDGHVGPALFYGDLPLWRTFDRASSTVPTSPSSNRTSPISASAPTRSSTSSSTSHTLAAIKAWQDSRGFKKTGVVSPGDVVIEAGPGPGRRTERPLSATRCRPRSSV